MEPRPLLSRGRGSLLFGGVFVGDFLISLLDLCLLPFRSTDNLLVFVPTACFTVSFLFIVVRLLLHGGRLR